MRIVHTKEFNGWVEAMHASRDHACMVSTTIMQGLYPLTDPANTPFTKYFLSEKKRASGSSIEINAALALMCQPDSREPIIEEIFTVSGATSEDPPR